MDIFVDIIKDEVSVPCQNKFWATKKLQWKNVQMANLILHQPSLLHKQEKEESEHKILIWISLAWTCRLILFFSKVRPEMGLAVQQLAC